MNVFITDTDETIGYPLARELANADHTVLLHTVHALPASNDESIRTIGDGISYESIRSATDQIGPVDCLIHLSSYTSRSAESDITVQEAADQFAILHYLLEAMGKTVSSLVYASSMSVYGNPGSHEHTINDPLSPVTVEGVEKLTCESYLRGYCSKYMIPLSVLRLTPYTNFIKHAKTDAYATRVIDTMQRCAVEKIDAIMNCTPLSPGLTPHEKSGKHRAK